MPRTASVTHSSNGVHVDYAARKRAFRICAYKAGYKGPAVLHREAERRFGRAAASLVTFKRLFSKGVTENEQAAATQAAEIFGCQVSDLREGKAEAVTPTTPVSGHRIERQAADLLPTIDKAVSATLGNPGDVERTSKRLMDSRLGSLHAFLTFHLADQLQAQDATGGA